jgi:hypothetical protein
VSDEKKYRLTVTYFEEIIRGAVSRDMVPADEYLIMQGLPFAEKYWAFWVRQKTLSHYLSEPLSDAAIDWLEQLRRRNIILRWECNKLPSEGEGEHWEDEK